MTTDTLGVSVALGIGLTVTTGIPSLSGLPL